MVYLFLLFTSLILSKSAFLIHPFVLTKWNLSVGCGSFLICRRQTKMLAVLCCWIGELGESVVRKRLRERRAAVKLEAYLCFLFALVSSLERFCNRWRFWSVFCSEPAELKTPWRRTKCPQKYEGCLYEVGLWLFSAPSGCLRGRIL